MRKELCAGENKPLPETTEFTPANRRRLDKLELLGWKLPGVEWERCTRFLTPDLKDELEKGITPANEKVISAAIDEALAARFCGLTKTAGRIFMATCSHILNTPLHGDVTVDTLHKELLAVIKDKSLADDVTTLDGLLPRPVDVPTADGTSSLSVLVTPTILKSVLTDKNENFSALRAACFGSTRNKGPHAKYLLDGRIHVKDEHYHLPVNASNNQSVEFPFYVRLVNHAGGRVGVAVTALGWRKRLSRFAQPAAFAVAEAVRLGRAILSPGQRMLRTASHNLLGEWHASWAMGLSDFSIVMDPGSKGVMASLIEHDKANKKLRLHRRVWLSAAEFGRAVHGSSGYVYDQRAASVIDKFCNRLVSMVPRGSRVVAWLGNGCVGGFQGVWRHVNFPWKQFTEKVRRRFVTGQVKEYGSSSFAACCLAP